MTVTWQELQIPFAAGLNGKAGPRALQPPALAVCKNAEFDDVGELRPRKPWRDMPMDVIGGGTITTVRSVAVYNDELLLFSDDTLYSWSESDQKWARKAEYLATTVEERSSFVNTNEQTLADRAELAGVALCVWQQDSVGSAVYAAAYDVATGAVVYPPQQVTGSISRPRVIALESRILLFGLVSATGLSVRVIDPADIGTGIGAAWTLLGNGGSYDVAQYDTTIAVVAWRTLGGQYDVSRVTELGVATTVAKARACDGPIAVTASPRQDVVVIRASGTAVIGDVLSAILADVTVNVPVGTAAGTPVNQIAAGCRTVLEAAEYRVYVWYSAQEKIAGSFATRANWIDTSGTTGVDGHFIWRLGIGSRAWERDGRVFVWLTMGQSNPTANLVLQGTYFAYRDDHVGEDLVEAPVQRPGYLVAKAVSTQGGGYAAVDGHLPTVQALDGDRYAVALIERRIFATGQQEEVYAARAPREVWLSYDDDRARRTVQLGATCYLTGAQVQQYDGQQVVELGFPLFPYSLSVVDSGIAGLLEAGTYTWRPGVRWENAQGEQERSTSATFFDAAIASLRKASIVLVPVHVTGKVLERVLGRPAIEVWRTTANPPEPAPQYLTTSRDPTATGENGYLENNTSLAALATYIDNLSDASLLARESHPENAGRLEQLAPPGGLVIAADASRLFLAGVPGYPHRVVYSQLRELGELATFFDGLVVDLPSAGGEVMALSFIGETLVVLRETAIYVVPGQGFTNTGTGDNYGPARIAATDVGAVSAEAVAVTPEGLIFKSQKGWYMLDRGFTPRYIGAPVADFDGDTIRHVEVLENQHQIRCVTDARILVYDYLVEQWAEWTTGSQVSSVLWQGQHVIAGASTVRRQQTDFVRDASTESAYGIDVETAWIKPADLQGYVRTRHVMTLGEYRSDHHLRVRMARDYATDFHQLTTWAPTSTAVGAREQIRTACRIQKCEAIKVRITAVSSTAAAGALGAVGADLGDDPPDGEAVRLTGMLVTVGIKTTANRLSAGEKR